MSDRQTVIRLAAMLQMTPQQLLAAVTVGEQQLWRSFFASTFGGEVV